MVRPEYDYDFWLFDLDGTLVDTEPGHARSVLDRVGERIDREFTDREVAVLWHGLGGERNEILRSWGIDPDRFWAALHEVESAEDRAAASFLHEDAAALLDRLRGEAPIGIVTHCQPYLTEAVLDRLGLRGRFETVVCCSAELGWKPDPAPVRQAIADLEVTADDEGVLVGDAPGDVGAAWNAGLDAVHVERHGHRRRERCVLADHRVNELTELLAPERTPTGAPGRADVGGDE